MTQYIDKSALVAYIEKTEEISKDAADKAIDTYFKIHFDGWVTACRSILSFINTLEVKESDETASDETAKAFARIIRANLTGIDKDVQYKFEQLYKEITGKKMYQGYSD